MHDSIRGHQDERGAAALIVAIFMGSLFTMVALVFDVGALLQERRELQNGADAAALAVAEDCAYDVLDCLLSKDATSDALANPNAEDDTTTVDDVEIDVGAQTVSVNTSTSDPGGGSIIVYKFAQLFSDNTGKAVQAHAIARWGAVGSLKTVPLTIHECEWIPPPPPPLGSATVTIVFHSGQEVSCANPTAPANQNAPGNFGWLDPNTGEPCEVKTEADASAPGRTGTPNPGPTLGCSPTEHFVAGDIIYMPIFDSASGQGTNTTYHIDSYAAFEIEAYHLSSANGWQSPTGYTCPLHPSSNCITGKFVKRVPLDAVLGGPGVTDRGVKTVTLIK